MVFTNERIARVACVGGACLLLLGGCTDDAPRSESPAPSLQTLHTGPAPGLASDLPREVGATDGWAATVQAALRDGPYQLRTDDDGTLRFRNPAHALSAQVLADGSVSLAIIGQADAPLVVGVGELEIALRTVAWGRADEESALSEPGSLGSTCAPGGRTDPEGQCLRRAELHRDGLLEWWSNGGDGLEQGWTVPERPSGDGELSIEVMVDGADVEVAKGGAEAVFSAGARRLRYGALAASDAKGRALDVWMEGTDGGLRLLVEDAGAIYPVTVDPLLTPVGWTAESDQAGAFFGYSVSSAGDVNGDGYGDVIVGATGYDNGQVDEGGAFLYFGSAVGLASAATWTAESNQAGAAFGHSVSSAGDVNGDGFGDVVVGAHLYDNGETDEGMAFLYLGSAGGLASSPVWTAESDQATAQFGGSISSAGDVNGDGFGDVVVAAVRYDDGEANEGRVSLFLGSAGGLASTAAWTAESNQAGALFGEALSDAGDVNGDGFGDVVVGAPYYDAGETDEGRAFLYLGSAAGLGSSAAWTGESDQVSALFGISVSSAGDVNGDGFGDVVVGAVYYDAGETDEGRAFLYLGSAGGLASSAAWTAESDQPGAGFGRSVSSAGDVNGDGFGDVVVGAIYYDNGQTDEGGAFLYLGSAGGLASNAAWNAESDQANAYFGLSVSSVGDVNGDGFGDVIVGAYYYDNGQTDEGRAFLYYGSDLALRSTPGWTAESDQPGAGFAYAVASAGDVNGDGFGDVVVGARSYDNGETDEGGAFLYLGSAGGLASSAAWTAESDQAVANFGWSVSSAGDVNGDGFGDVVIGAPDYGNGQSMEGRAYLYLGSAEGLAAAPSWTAESDQTGAAFGLSVSSAGDVNGDGFSDVVVGAYGYDNGEAEEGRAFLYLGSAAGLSPTADWTAESDQPGANFGRSVSAAGDVNGDGFGDVIVGAYSYDGGQTDEGAAFAYLGSASGLSTTPAWIGQQNNAGALFGGSVSSAGDVNGDGFGDVVIGASSYAAGQANQGAFYVYRGSASGIEQAAAWGISFAQADAFLGGSVASAGDVNGDGYGDVIVGAYAYDNGEVDEGTAFLYLGSSLGLQPSPAWTGESDQANANLGISVASAGDVNGDGYGDVIVGADQYDNGENNEGAAFLYLGAASGLAAAEAWTAESDQAGAYFGNFVASAGDVNGDGYGDVIVGAPFYDNGESDEGGAFLYLGSASGLSATAAWTAESNQADARLGASVSSAGDVNGDGYGDVVVGAYYYDDGQSNEGGAFLYLGSASGLSSSAAWTAESNQANASFGVSVASAGDVNGDGFSDVVVGAHLYDNGETDEGRAFLYLGSASGLSTNAVWTAESNQADAYFGNTVASAGDVNGDGYGDVLVGAWYYDNGEPDEGRAFLFLGSAAGLSSTAAWTAESNQAGAGFGLRSSSAGDVNGDGYGDVVIGAHYYDNPESDEGRAYLYMGSSSGLSATAAWVAESDQAYALFGTSVSSAGDVNGDGFGDVLVGANFYSDGEYREGHAFLYLGSASGLSPTANWTAESNQPYGAFGNSVSSAGDVNGDGYSDVVVGAVYFDNGETDEGGAFLYLGNGGDGTGAGRLRLTRALQPGTSTPISAGLRSTATTSFDVSSIGRSPFGRTAVKLQVEAKPLGTPFDGTGLLTSSAWTDSGVLGASLQEQIGSLSAETAYHWRARVLYDPADAPPQLGSPWVWGGLSGHPEGSHVVTGCVLDTDGDGQCDSTDLDDDNDGDPDATDCDDGDPLVLTGATEICDGVDQDCDAVVDDGFDVDNDGVTTCGADGSPATTTDNDCDDGVPTTFPGATETCNAIDDDCDAVVDDGFDVDNDGVTTCGPDGSSATTTDNDCDDAVPTTFPGAAETCNAVDDDCDAVVDDGFDTDSDGVTTCGPDGVAGNADDDCADGDPVNFPGNAEVCDAVDNDCDGSITNGLTDADGDGQPDCIDTCVDADGDGLGTGANGNSGCPGGTTTDSSDSSATSCGDTDGDTCDDCVSGTFAPGSDGADADSDGLCDLGDTCEDLDGDGLGNGVAGNAGCVDPTIDANDTSTYLCGDTDTDGCEDCLSGAFDPADDGADEDGDGICSLTDPDDDNDCFVDADELSCSTDPLSAASLPADADADCSADCIDDCVDADGDGLGATGFDLSGCTDTTLADADDTSGTVCGDSDADACDDCSTGAFDPADDGDDADSDGLCDAGDLDDDADGWDDADEVACGTDPLVDTSTPADLDGDTVCDALDDCVDADGDGLGNGANGNTGCSGGTTTDGNDASATVCGDSDNDTCDDCVSGTFAPAADGPDLDGDGLCDAGDVDADGDGVTTALDCDDADASIYPSATEVCDEIDQDCDNDLLEEWADVNLNGVPDCAETDADGDGVPGGEGANDDCDDSDELAFPGAAELCDGIDNDCDADIDEELDAVDWYADSDRDGFGDPQTPHPDNPTCEDIGDGWVQDDSDCDDADPDVNVDTAEVCDGIDNDCEGTTDIDADGGSICGCDGVPTPSDIETECSDGLDDDCNGRTDAEDQECAGNSCTNCQSSVSGRPDATALWLLPLLVLRRRRAPWRSSARTDGAE